MSAACGGCSEPERLGAIRSNATRFKRAVRHITSRASNKVLPQAGSYIATGSAAAVDVKDIIHIDLQLNILVV